MELQKQITAIMKEDESLKSQNVQLKLELAQQRKPAI